MNRKKVILIGKPLSHSLSPVLHNTWLAELNILSLYEACEIEPEEVKSLILDLKEGRIGGINATIPYKEILFSLAEEAEASAQALQAANTLYMGSGKVWAKNTDPEGFSENLKYQATNWTGKDRTGLVLGTGAAAKAAVYSLLGLAVSKVFVCGRDLTRAENLKTLFDNEAVKPISWQDRNTLAPGLSLVVNTTPLGLAGFGEVDLDLENLAKDCLVYDLVYGREKTVFLKKAEALGLQTIDGLGMLVFQGIPAFETWFGIRPAFSPSLLDLLRKRI